MKVVIATNTGGVEDTVFPTFGRCPTYTVIEIENNEVKDTKVEKNPGATMPGGAGIAAAQFVVNLGAEAVIAGNYGPNAMNIMKQAGIKTYSAFNLKVKDAIDQLIKGELKEAAAGAGPGMGSGRGMGPGGGMGRGAGMGAGRGMSRGGGRWQQ